MADVGPDDPLREPNDDAYLKTQVRVGPPLEYVAGEFGHALVTVGDLLRNMRRRKQDEVLISQAICLPASPLRVSADRHLAC